jgi:hypothetical protein
MNENDHFPTDDRDQQILRRLANIEHKVDSIEQTTAFTLRADAKRHFETVKAIFGKSKRRAQVYLASNGERSVQNIAGLLDMKQPNVSRELTFLQEILENEGGENYWCKKTIDKTIRISTFLKKEYNLSKDGLPTN